MIASILAASAGLLAAATEPGAEAGYRLDLKLYRAGELVGSPTITTRAGAPARVEVGGARGYRLDLEVADAVPAAFAAATGYEAGPEDRFVRTVISLPTAQGWSSAATPSMIVRLGEEASVTLFPSEDGGGLAHHVRLEMRVVPLQD